MGPRRSLDHGDKYVDDVPLMHDEKEHVATPRPRFSQATIKATFMAVATILILAALNIHDLAMFGSISLPGFSKGRSFTFNDSGNVVTNVHKIIMERATIAIIMTITNIMATITTRMLECVSHQLVSMLLPNSCTISHRITRT